MIVEWGLFYKAIVLLCLACIVFNYHVSNCMHKRKLATCRVQWNLTHYCTQRVIVYNVNADAYFDAFLLQPAVSICNMLSQN